MATTTTTGTGTLYDKEATVKIEYTNNGNGTITIHTIQGKRASGNRAWKGTGTQKYLYVGDNTFDMGLQSVVTFGNNASATQYGDWKRQIGSSANVNFDWTISCVGQQSLKLHVSSGDSNIDSFECYPTFDGGYPATNPVVSTSYSNVGRTSAYIVGSVDSWGAGAGSYSISCSNGYYGSGVSQTWVNGLTPNTQYSFTFSATNSANLSSSSTGYFTTSYKAPDITNIDEYFLRVGNKYTLTFMYNVTFYDTSYGSHMLGLGLSPDAYIYPGTSTMTGTTAAFTVDNLEPNTTYYYLAKETDSSGISSQVTGSFTTPCNPPTVSATILPVVGGFTITPNAVPDINDAITSVSVKYRINGSSDAYVTNSLTNNSPTTINNLNHNATYEYIVEAWGVNKGTYSSTVTTLNNSPTVSLSTTNITAKSATIVVNATFDSASLDDIDVKYRIKNSGSSWSTTTVSTTSIALSNLATGKLYEAEVTVNDTAGNYTTSTIEFKTLGGIEYMGRAALEAKLNGHIVLGMRINGNDIL